MMKSIGQITLLITSITAASAFAAEIGPDDDLEAAVAALSPGEVLELRGGTYFFDENVTLTANGTVSQPIIVRAKDGESGNPRHYVHERLARHPPDELGLRDDCRL